MDFLKNLGETFNEAVDFVIEKNRKFNKAAKIKKQIKKESNAVVKAYITLGKHYYKDLRDVPNYDMQKLCNSIDYSKNEIKRLKNKLEEIKNEVNLSEFEEFVENEDYHTENKFSNDTPINPNLNDEDSDEIIENTEDNLE